MQTNKTTPSARTSGARPGAGATARAADRGQVRDAMRRAGPRVGPAGRRLAPPSQDRLDRTSLTRRNGPGGADNPRTLNPSGRPGTRGPGTAPPAAPKGQGPAQNERPRELRDGQWLHDPRQLTPGQARELEELGRNPNTHPDTRRNIQQFLDDYRNNRDRLFPDDPNPLPRPYPQNPAAPLVG